MPDSLRELLRQRASEAGVPAGDLTAGAIKRSRAIGRRRLAAGTIGAVAGLAVTGMAAAALSMPGEREDPAPPIDDPVTVTTSPSPTASEDPTEGAPTEGESVEDDATEGPGDETSSAADDDSTSPQETEEADIDPRLEAIVGTWEAEYEDVGPHGSSLTIEEDGTATLRSFANQHGPYEGEIILGSQDPHRFEGVESETQDEIVVEFGFDPEADTLTLTYPSGESYVHHRV
ncbi:hypothetical protein [Glycomyces tenuis]|uniref:hypothetical protein n=1 Tax=Glycomyces tenuis TaxID=58116 RepID=UPI000424E583|nr:hypothetical protein [Glycomyces tenuis]